MIHFDALDFSEWHSEEVIGFFWRSVYVHYTAVMMLTRSLREPGGPYAKSMEVSESRMERVKTWTFKTMKLQFVEQ